MTVHILPSGVQECAVFFVFESRAIILGHSQSMVQNLCLCYAMFMLGYMVTGCDIQYLKKAVNTSSRIS